MENGIQVIAWPIRIPCHAIWANKRPRNTLRSSGLGAKGVYRHIRGSIYR